MLKRLSENVHLPFDKPFDKLMALSKVKGLHYPHSSGFVRATLGLPTLRAGPRFRPAAKTAGWTFSTSLSEIGFQQFLEKSLLAEQPFEHTATALQFPSLASEVIPFRVHHVTVLPRLFLWLTFLWPFSRKLDSCWTGVVTPQPTAH